MDLTKTLSDRIPEEERPENGIMVRESNDYKYVLVFQYVGGTLAGALVIPRDQVGVLAERLNYVIAFD